MKKSLKNTLILAVAFAASCLAVQSPFANDKSIEDIRVGVYLNTTRGATSYGSDGMRMALEDYDIHTIFVPDFKPETIEGLDVVAVPAIVRFPPGTDLDKFREELRAYVKAGGGIVLIQESVGWRQSYEQGHGYKDKGVIPEVGMGTSIPVDGRNAWGPISLTPLVVQDKAHPISSSISAPFDQQYDGAPLKPGPDGKVIMTYADDVIVRAVKYKLDKTPAVIVGKFGKGRVVLSGPAVGLDRQPREFEGPPTGDMLRYFLNSVVWAAGLDTWKPFDIIED